MTKIRRFFDRLFSFPSQHLVVLMLLACASVLQSFTIVSLDSLATGLYLGRFGQMDLAFNFLLTAFFLSFVAKRTIKMEHRMGQGLPVFLFLSFSIQTLLLFLYRKGHMQTLDCLFIFKFIYRFVLTIGFWALVLRFLDYSLRSKRFLFLVLCDFLGLLCASPFIHIILPWLGISALWALIAAATFILFLFVSKVSQMGKVSIETLVPKNGGVQEASQKKLVYLIYTTAFILAAIRCFIEYVLCIDVLNLSLSAPDLIRFFANIFFVVGLLNFISLSLLYRVRQTIHLMNGILMIVFLPLISYLGWAARMFWIVVFVKILWEVLNTFCVGYYFRMIPRPLSHGNKTRLKYKRLIMVEPAGFATIALIFYFLPFPKFISITGTGLSFALLIASVLTQKEYSNVLLSTFKTFRWRGGQLMLSNKKILSFINEKIVSKNPDEVIYFLRVLEEAQVPDFSSFLKKALKHPDEQVRAFVLGQIEKYNLSGFKRTLFQLLEKDPSVQIRNLTLQIICSSDEPYSEEKAILYLNDPTLRKGAITGLLKCGGEGVLIASGELQKMVSSSKISDRLEAAQILEEVGLKGLFRDVQLLLHDENKIIQETALLAAGRTGNPLLLTDVFKALNSLTLRNNAIQALKLYGKKVYPAISNAFSDPKRTWLCKKTLMTYLWIAQDEDSKKTLFSSLQTMPFSLRLDSLRFLHKTETQFRRSYLKKKILPLIEEDQKQMLILLSHIKDLSIAPSHDAQDAFDLLGKSLKDEFESLRQAILLELSVLQPYYLMKKAVRTLLDTHAKSDEKEMALGLIEDLLPKKIFSLLPFIRQHSFSELFVLLSDKIAPYQMDMATRFRNILNDVKYHSPWTKANALYCIRRLSLIDVREEVLSLLSDENPFIRENAVWATERLFISKDELKKVLKPLEKDPANNVALLAKEILKDEVKK